MIRKLGKIALWTLVFAVVPMVASADTGGGDGSWGYALGAGLAIGLAGLGCGIGQGLTAGNTTAGIARNPGAAGAMFAHAAIHREKSEVESARPADFSRMISSPDSTVPPMPAKLSRMSAWMAKNDARME